MTICLDCGHVAACPHCSVALTYHYDRQLNLCHYCAYSERVKSLCSDCSSNKLDKLGQGTQKVEKEIKSLFPQARIARLDLDLSRRQGLQKEILEKMQKQEIDILVGTQILAKGFDFPAVSLVGVIDVDSLMHLPDYRASERSFQLIVQVAGRAGRHDIPGEVVIQSYNPKNKLLITAAQQDYLAFYYEEIKQRKLLHYPPFTNVLRLVISSIQELSTSQVAKSWAIFFEELLDAKEDYFEILGPAPCQIYKIKDRYRYNILLKCDNIFLLRSIANYVWRQKNSEIVKIDVDINPLNMM